MTPGAALKSLGRDLTLLTAIVAGAPLAVAHAASAQGLPVTLLPEGDERVRVTIERGGSESRVVIGSFQGLAAEDFLVGQPAAPHQLIVISSVTRLDLSSGTSRWGGALRGLGLGALAGAVLGVTIGVVVPDPDSCDWVCTRSERAIVGAIVGIAYGVPAGTLLGALIGVERWHTVWER
jgi:hypothetical protein